MKIFFCDFCTQFVYFENSLCNSCGHTLGFSPELGKMCAWESSGDDVWTTPADSTGSAYRRCLNYSQENVCNWMVSAAHHSPYCMSCDLNVAIPDLTCLDRRTYWFRMEVAKRRLVYTLLQLQLPVVNRRQDPDNGLGFIFEAGPELNPIKETPVITGHDNGVITINLAEADDAVREKTRIAMSESYRTLLGHFRHEIGHYYWFRLIRDDASLSVFREVFGDESQNYDKALKAYYKSGPVPDWTYRFVSAYASAHPFEDWAESWAHYLHMIDTHETSNAWGLTIQPETGNNMVHLEAAGRSLGVDDFDAIVDRWAWISRALNSLNRSMGQPDVYPFALSGPAIEKLRFIHQRVQQWRGSL